MKFVSKKTIVFQPYVKLVLHCIVIVWNVHKLVVQNAKKVHILKKGLVLLYVLIKIVKSVIYSKNALNVEKGIIKDRIINVNLK